MTKKEQAAFDQMKRELRIKGALRWTSPVVPDVPIPKGWGDLSKGYIPVGVDSYSGVSIEIACTSSDFHAIRRNDKTTSQRPLRLYSTKLLALMAARTETEQSCAEKLAKIDEQIEAESRP